MILTSLEITNFGVFAGSHVLDLAPRDPSRPVVLIGGLNGCGKTTILDAIQLGLYGKQRLFSQDGSEGYSHLIRKTIHRGKLPSEGARVAITFLSTDETGEKKYRVMRHWSFRGDSLHETLNVEVDGVPNAFLSENWPREVDRFIPPRLAPFFFFDGEKIEELANPTDSARVLRTAVHSLLGVDIVEQLIADLRVLERRKIRDTVSGPSKGQLDAAEEAVKITRKRVDAAHQALASTQVDHDRTLRDIATFESQYSQSGGNLFEEQQNLEQSLSQTETHAADVMSRMGHLVAGNLPLTLVREQLEEIRGLVETEEHARRAAVLRDRLEERDSALLRHISKKGLADADVRAVEVYLNRDRTKLSKAAAVDLKIDMDAQGAHRLTHLVETSLQSESDETQRALEELAELDSEASLLQRRLNAVPDAADLAKLQRDLDEAKAMAKTVENQLDRQHEDHERAVRESEQANQEFERTFQAVRESGLANDDIHRIVDHGERVRDTLKAFRNAMVSRRADWLQEQILESYTQLLKKRALLGGIRIDPESCELTLLDRFGEPMEPDRLSAGERQLLAVSILWGLARASSRPMPVVIDTPLGRLDSNHRINLIEEYFPEASHQVLLLSTDEEITPAYYERLKPHIDRCYLLEHDDATGSSSIREGYFFEEAELCQ